MQSRKSFARQDWALNFDCEYFRNLRSEGFADCMEERLQSNIASLSLARSVGFKEIGDIYYRKFFSFEKWRYKRVRD